MCAFILMRRKQNQKNAFNHPKKRTAENHHPIGREETQFGGHCCFPFHIALITGFCQSFEVTEQIRPKTAARRLPELIN